MQLEEMIAKELADIIKETTGSFVDQIRAIEKAVDARLTAMEAKELPHADDAPEDVIDSIAKAIALLAERAAALGLSRRLRRAMRVRPGGPTLISLLLLLLCDVVGVAVEVVDRVARHLAAT